MERTRETGCEDDSWNDLLSGVKGKVVPALNYAPHLQDVWRSGGISPRILNLGTGLR